MKAISETLGLESDYITNATNWDQGVQLVAANFYPACPQPDRAIGLPPHTDHGLVTLLIQNNVGGLQIKHKGQWVNFNAMPNAFVVNIADQLQVLYYFLKLISPINIHISMLIRSYLYKIFFMLIRPYLYAPINCAYKHVNKTLFIFGQ